MKIDQMKTLLSSWMLLLTVLSFVSCERVLFPVPAEGLGTSVDTTLKDFMPFPFGAAINMTRTDTQPLYKATVEREYNSLTSEGAMKMRSIRPAIDSFYFAGADRIVDFAELNGMRMHGHTLVWAAIPDWLRDFPGDSTAWEQILKNHIQTVVTHYKGRVASWDVVNEAIADNGTIRQNIWYQKLGPGYIARSFQYAHEADSAALLFYNDYGHEYSSARRNGINSLLRSLLADSVPVHGIGLQMHTNINIHPNALRVAIDSAAATGLLVHISELDISVNRTNDPNYVLTPAVEADQAELFRVIAEKYASLPSSQQFGITTWNVGDLDTWRRPTYGFPDFPLPFDVDYNRKLAYYALIEGAN